MSNKIITGKIIRILSNSELIFNIGSKDGAYIGEKFEIFEPGENIVDPADKVKVLGKLDYIKAVVEITELHENFSLAKKIVKEERVKNVGLNPLSAFNQSTKTETVYVEKTIPVDESQIQARNIKNPNISLNDPVRSIH